MAYTDVRDFRGAQPFEQQPFPQVTVQISPRRQTIVAGREQFSHANDIDQNIVEITDSLTLVRGTHTLRSGRTTSSSISGSVHPRQLRNYRFSSLTIFQAGSGQQYDYSFSASSDPLQAPSSGSHKSASMPATRGA